MLVCRALLSLISLSAAGCLTVPAPSAAGTSGRMGQTFWPRGARAAVSLTYDDGLRSHRENAARQLAAYHVYGTFFLTGTSQDLNEHRAEWQDLLVAGHELGSHTMHHPCNRSSDWVKPGFSLQDYDSGRMKTELEETVSMLQGLGARTPYTFAYPCGATEVGENRQSYAGLVSQLFVAARGIEEKVADPRSAKLELVPAHNGMKSEPELFGLVDRAIAERGWLVLYFHGIGGDHLAVTLDTHEALLEYLERHRETVWTERFGVVAAHVQSQRRQAPVPG